MATQLSISLLGQFAVTLDDVTLTRFRTAKSRLLLAYIASQPDIEHPRDKLATLLWGDLPEASAKTNLRIELSSLKKILSAHPALVITRYTVRLRSDLATIDVGAFEANLESDSAEILTTALSHYQGEFIPALHLSDAPDMDDWRLLKQEQLHQQAMHAYDRLQTLLVEKDQWMQLATTAQRQLAIAPWNESTYCFLIQAHAGLGDLQEAQAQYDRCREMLADELGVTPSAETEALWQRLNNTAPQHNLPRELTPFFGRTTELAQLEEALAEGQYRLFTLSGIGGTGKTRLAIAFAQAQMSNFADGVWFVPLADLDSAEAVVPAIASVFDLDLNAAQLTKQLHSHLHTKQLLLILDNLEQLHESVADIIHNLLQATEHLIILATSRRRLQLRAEAFFPIAGLPDQPALTLFNDQVKRINRFARIHDPDIAIEICQLVEGLPLGIELAVAQSEGRELASVVEALREGMHVLETTMYDVPKRQRSLRAVFESSWIQLSDAEKQVLARLSIFRGGAALKDVQTIVPAATHKRLAHLINHSLLRLDEHGRYVMHPLVREFAAEKRSDADSTPGKHSQYFLSVIANQPYPFDLDNVRAAWRWALDEPDLALLQRSGTAFKEFMLGRGYMINGAALIAEGVIISAKQDDSETEARLLMNQADLVRRHHHVNASLDLLYRALRLNPSRRVRADLHGQLGAILLENGQTETGLGHLEIQLSLAREIGDPYVLVAALDEYAYLRVRHFIGDYQLAISQMLEALDLINTHQLESRRTFLYSSLTIAFIRYGNYAEALQYGRINLELARQNDDRSQLAQTLLDLALALDFAGRSDQAINYYKESLTISTQNNNLEKIGLLNVNFCLAYRRMGDPEKARAHGEIGIEKLNKLGTRRMEGQGRNRMGHTLLEMGRLEEAHAAYLAANELWESHAHPNQYEALAGLAATSAELGHLDDARRYLDTVLTFAYDDNLHKVVEPCLLLLNCATAMRILNESPEPALNRAFEWMNIIASRISDEALRTTYVMEIRQHQRLRDEMAALQRPV